MITDLPLTDQQTWPLARGIGKTVAEGGTLSMVGILMERSVLRRDSP
jgi:hypothetical protein